MFVVLIQLQIADDIYLIEYLFHVFNVNSTF
jgi:hypothetical protein